MILFWGLLFIFFFLSWDVFSVHLRVELRISDYACKKKVCGCRGALTPPDKQGDFQRWVENSGAHLATTNCSEFVPTGCFELPPTIKSSANIWQENIAEGL